jgi:ATP-dependent DNA helicase RecG
MGSVMLTDTELLDLLRDPESDRAERRASAADRSAIRRAICAFANDVPGHGRPAAIFIGVRDDGSCANLAATDEMIRTLAAMRDDGNIHPFPTMAVQRRRLANCDLVVIEVTPADNPPVRYRGRVWVRVGSSVRLATAEEERRLVEKRRWGNLPFDEQGVPRATLDDLDIVRFRLEYLPAVVPRDVLEVNDRAEEEQLRALRLLTPDGRPTVAAVLLIGKDPRYWLPGAYVQFVSFAGATVTDSIQDQKEIGGTLVDQLRRLDELLEAHVRLASDLSSGRELRHPDYPVVALQELGRNALIHRTYEGTNSPVHLYWYSDRVEIRSPGGPFGRVTAETFGQPGMVDYRNPVLAEAANRLGYIQRFGMGISRARGELAGNGNPPPEFIVEPTTVLVTIRPRP